MLNSSNNLSLNAIGAVSSSAISQENEIILNTSDISQSSSSSSGSAGIILNMGPQLQQLQPKLQSSSAAITQVTPSLAPIVVAAATAATAAPTTVIVSAPSSSSGTSSNAATTATTVISPFLTKSKLHDVIGEVDASLQLDDDVEETLIAIADAFVERAIDGSCKIARHRNSKVCESRDVRLYTEQQYGIWTAGFGTDELKPYRRSADTEAHRQRIMLIKRFMKK